MRALVAAGSVGKHRIVHIRDRYAGEQRVLEAVRSTTDDTGDAMPGETARRGAIHGKRCDECGAHAVIRKDGCQFCTSCGSLGSCG